MAVIGRRAGAARTTAIADERTGGVVVLLYLVGVVLSERPTVELLGLNLTPIRMLLLVVFIPAFVTLCKIRDLRLQAFDWLIIFFAAWLLAGLLVNNGPERAFKYGGSLALEVLGGYLIARAYVRTPSQFGRTVRWYVWLVAIIGAFAIPEALFDARIFDFLKTAVPEDHFALPADDNNYIRFGLRRAAVTFDHPILYGAFCATSFGLAWYVYINNPVRWIVLCAILSSAFLSVSSAALLACALAGGFIVWEKLTRFIRYRTAITLSVVAAVLIVLQVMANRSLLAVILPFVSLNHWTAYYRLLIWEYATANISASPLFGIGLNDWERPAWMPPSVDSFWLVVALTGGFPAVTALVVAVVLLLARVHVRRGFVEATERWQTRFGWTVAVLALCMQALTTHYWGAMHSFFFFVLGLGAWMSDSKKGLMPKARLEGRTTSRVRIWQPPSTIRQLRADCPSDDPAAATTPVGVATPTNPTLT